MPNWPTTTDNTQVSSSEISFINKVYAFMMIALLITTGVAYYVGNFVNPASINQYMMPAVIAEVIIVLGISFIAHKVPSFVVLLCFLFYSALNGFTLSIIFQIYTKSSIVSTCGVASLTFGVMSLYGTITKRDLTSIGNLCFFALLGLIITGLVNMFLRSNTVEMVTSFIGVLIFVGLTAYDTQKIKQIGESGYNHTGTAVLGALELYLDLINLVLYLLRLFGRRK